MWLEISLKLFQQLHPIFFHFYLSRTYLALLSLKKKSVTLIVIINVSIKKTNTLGFRTEHHLNQSNHNRAYCTKVVLMDLMPLKKKKALPHKIPLHDSQKSWNCKWSWQCAIAAWAERPRHVVGLQVGSIPCHMRERVELLKLWLACDS